MWRLWCKGNLEENVNDWLQWAMSKRCWSSHKKDQKTLYEDERFLKIKQEISKVGKHHQLPLPLRNENMSLPNNQNMVEKRLMHLKRWFQKQFKFYEDYNRFMEEIMRKGCAREAKTNPPDERTWYLPHHGVYHPQKPSKLRVVFDCSAELNRSSNNKELLLVHTWQTS